MRWIWSRRWRRDFGRHYIRDMVYAANDGLITTFAAVAGVRGAELSTLVVLALGFANLAADGLSMAVGNYLGIKSERAADLLEDYQEWEETVHAARHGVVTWAAFVAAGLLPLVPFLFGLAMERAFWISLVVSAASMFGIGALRTRVTQRSAWRSGGEMLAVGTLAGLAAFGAGWIVGAATGG